MLTKNALLTGVGLGLVALTRAEFTLTAPVATEMKGGDSIPCGEYDARDRTQVTEWPVLGHDVGVNIQGGTSTFVIRAALVDDLTKFVTLRPAVYNRGGGDLCFMRIRGVEDWVGKEALVEVRQYTGGGGYFHRCAAVTFVEGGPAPPACRGFHAQLVQNHERRLKEKAQGGQGQLGRYQETHPAEKARLEQRGLGIGYAVDNTARASVVVVADDDFDDDDDDDDDDDAVDDDDFRQKTSKPAAGSGHVSTYTHMPATPVPSHSAGSHPSWTRNQTAPLPTGQAGTLDASQAPRGLSRGFVLLNLGLVASLVVLFSL